MTFPARSLRPDRVICWGRHEPIDIAEDVRKTDLGARRAPEQPEGPPVQKRAGVDGRVHVVEGQRRVEQDAARRAGVAENEDVAAFGVRRVRPRRQLLGPGPAGKKRQHQEARPGPAPADRRPPRLCHLTLSPHGTDMLLDRCGEARYPHREPGAVSPTFGGGGSPKDEGGMGEAPSWRRR